jgi:hypothetical protein
VASKEQGHRIVPSRKVSLQDKLMAFKIITPLQRNILNKWSVFILKELNQQHKQELVIAWSTAILKLIDKLSQAMVLHRKTFLHYNNKIINCKEKFLRANRLKIKW